MAWGWSHTQEAYRDAEANLRALPVNRIAEIWAEWGAAIHPEYGEPELRVNKYHKLVAIFYQHLLSDTLQDLREYGVDGILKPAYLEYAFSAIWAEAKEQATCTNGGWEAWLCPFGCGCHMVPFDREQS